MKEISVGFDLEHLHVETMPPEVKISADIEKLSCTVNGFQLRLSPVHPCTLNYEDREKARIPRSAHSFSWVYSTPDVPGFSFGGFMYFDSHRRTVRLNKVITGIEFQNLAPNLKFEGPFPLYPPGNVKLKGEELEWHKSNLFIEHASDYCWIPPQIKCDHSKYSHPLPSGGFAYRCSKDGQLVLFPLVKSQPDVLDDQKLKGALFQEYQSMITKCADQLLKSPDTTFNLFANDIPELNTDDALVIVDMQNDFMPGGGFGVAEGTIASKFVCDLVEQCRNVGATVIATRDYHPRGHVSFNVFPPHCIQGSQGSYLYEPVAIAVQSAYDVDNERTHIVFKGYHKDIDSFGCFPYPEEYADKRLTRQNACSVDFTGCIQLHCSNLMEDINAPPDIIVSSLKAESRSLKDILVESKTKRIFVCGLAFDFCVLDTALNAVSCGFDEVYIVLDAARAAYIPGVGKFGGGFLSDPMEIATKCSQKNVRLVMTGQLLGRYSEVNTRPQSKLIRVINYFLPKKSKWCQ